MQQRLLPFPAMLLSYLTAKGLLGRPRKAQRNTLVAIAFGTWCWKEMTDSCKGK